MYSIMNFRTNFIYTILLNFTFIYYVQGFFFPPFNSPTNERKIIVDVPTLITSNGYPSERHKVYTNDGYILEHHRIPYGRGEHADSPERYRKPIAFMVHCILCTSSIWVIQGTKNGLGYILADNGYDVWMVNVRGTSYSSRHVRLSPKQDKFWDFSFHEKGSYDMPASIDYVLDITNQTQVNYIAFSMGTTIFFAMAGSRPEYIDKIRTAVTIAPAVYMRESKGILLLSPFAKILGDYFRSTDNVIIPPKKWHVRDILNEICDFSNIFLRPFCTAAFSSIFGVVSMETLDVKNLGYYFQFLPDYTSMKTAGHFFQLKASDVFKQFDYGAAANLNIYGSSHPPLYNMSQITQPVHMFYSNADEISTPQGVHRLLDELPNAYAHEVKVPEFSHAHFCFGRNTRKIVYDKLLKVLLQP